MTNTRLDRLALAALLACAGMIVLLLSEANGYLLRLTILIRESRPVVTNGTHNAGRRVEGSE